jgi:hypothetical protein
MIRRLISLATCYVSLAAIAAAQVTIPWTDIDKTGSSLADFSTRSAGDLNSGTLDNARLDADLTSWAAITRASGFDAFTATPNSANLRALLTDETGTGIAYFVGGALGTPASGNASNLTALNATQLTSGTVPTARLYSTAAGYNITNGAALDALGAVATNGLLTRTGAGTYAARTITGTAGQITVANGDGVAGAPTISLPSAITGVSSVTNAGDFNLTSGAANSVIVSGQSIQLVPNTTSGSVLIGTNGSASNTLYFRSTSAIIDTTNTALSLKRQSGAANAAIELYNSSNTASSRIQSGVSSVDFWSPGGGTYWGGFYSGGLSVGPTTASTSTTTGSGTFGGGIGVAGDGWFGSGLNAANLALTQAAGNNRLLRYRTGASDRWAIYATSAAESGSNAGSNLNIARYSDAGSFIADALTINRSTGVIAIASTTASTSTTTGAVTVAGGIGVAGAGFFGGNVTTAGGQFGITSSASEYVSFATNITRLTAQNNQLNWSGVALYPTDDAARDLGITSTNRWRNLFLSGTVNASGALFTNGTIGTVEVGSSVAGGGSTLIMRGQNSYSTSFKSAASDRTWDFEGSSSGGSHTYRFRNAGAGGASIDVQGAGAFAGNISTSNGVLTATTPDGTAASLSLTQTARRQWRIRVPASLSTLEIADIDGGVTPLTISHTSGNAAFIGTVTTNGPTAGLGYAAGAGGAITQITSRTTGVTLNKVAGAITLFTAAGSATATSFTVTNSAVAATDTIVLSVKSGTNKYLCFVTAVAAGSFEITFYTTGGTSSDAPVINFAVLKAVAS